MLLTINYRHHIRMLLLGLVIHEQEISGIITAYYCILVIIVQSSTCIKLQSVLIRIVTNFPYMKVRENLYRLTTYFLWFGILLWIVSWIVRQVNLFY